MNKNNQTNVHTGDEQNCSDSIMDDILSSTDKCEKFAGVVMDEIRNDDEPLHHTGASIIEAYRNGDCDKLLIALCGWSMESLLQKYKEGVNDEPQSETKPLTCPDCQEESLRYAIIDIDGTNLEEGYECKECGETYIGKENQQVLEANPNLSENEDDEV